ncbi:hypothetical protein B0O99DRAFT_593793 [Bisporella sp. PMI_857]|nr:hypothetical protein B0O99DRAFT_593793 [Bisporella sp. PMI_857]
MSGKRAFLKYLFLLVKDKAGEALHMERHLKSLGRAVEAPALNSRRDIYRRDVKTDLGPKNERVRSTETTKRTTRSIGGNGRRRACSCSNERCRREYDWRLLDEGRRGGARARSQKRSRPRRRERDSEAKRERYRSESFSRSRSRPRRRAAGRGNEKGKREDFSRSGSRPRRRNTESGAREIVKSWGGKSPIAMSMEGWNSVVDLEKQKREQKSRYQGEHDYERRQNYSSSKKIVDPYFEDRYYENSRKNHSDDRYEETRRHRPLRENNGYFSQTETIKKHPAGPKIENHMQRKESSSGGVPPRRRIHRAERASEEKEDIRRYERMGQSRYLIRKQGCEDRWNLVERRERAEAEAIVEKASRPFEEEAAERKIALVGRRKENSSGSVDES